MENLVFLKRVCEDMCKMHHLCWGKLERNDQNPKLQYATISRILETDGESDREGN